MEKQDYSKFKEITIIDDLPIFFISGDIYVKNEIFEYFDRLGVKTLEDLFTAYDNGYFNDKRKKYNIEIKGQTELLMSHYIGTPLIADEVLGMKVSMNSIDDINEWYESKQNRDKILRIGFSKVECHLLYEYCCNKRDRILTDRNNMAGILEIISSFARDTAYQTGIIEEFSNELIHKAVQNIMFKAKFFEQYLEEKKYIVDGVLRKPTDNTVIDRTIVRNLEEQMRFLLYTRNNIDSQIELLQTQLSNVKNSGGIRK